MRVRTPARKVHVVPVANPDLIYHHLSLALKNGKPEGLGIEELVGDARQLRLVHQQDGTAARVELPLPIEDEALNGGDIPASPMKVDVKTNKNPRAFEAHAPAEALRSIPRTSYEWIAN